MQFSFFCVIVCLIAVAHGQCSCSTGCTATTVSNSQSINLFCSVAPCSIIVDTSDCTQRTVFFPPIFRFELKANIFAASSISVSLTGQNVGWLSSTNTDGSVSISNNRYSFTGATYVCGSTYVTGSISGTLTCTNSVFDCPFRYRIVNSQAAPISGSTPVPSPVPSPVPVPVPSAGCQCNCCSGNSCTASYVGNANNDGTCNSGCSSSNCIATFPSFCPDSGFSGTVQASCSGSTNPTPAPSSVAWAGEYLVGAGCSTSTCCCLTGTISVTQSGTLINISGGVTGQCGGVTAWTPSFTLSSTSAATVDFSYLGNSYRATKTGRVVSVTNLSATQCSGTATCQSGPCANSSNASSSIMMLSIVSLVSILILALILV
jgi:hypothetical protein